MRYCVGVDLGSEGDPTSVAIIERKEFFQKPPEGHLLHRWKDEPSKVISELHLIYMANLPLKTEYPDIAQKIFEMVNRPEFIGQTHLVVERNSIGLPVIQMMMNLGLNPIGVYTTSGNVVNPTKTHYNVPKVDLVMALLGALQLKRFKMPTPGQLPIIETFVDQLDSFQMKIKKSGSVTYENAQDRIHDDLVIATCLAVWWMDKIHGTGVEVKLNDDGFYPDWTPGKGLMTDADDVKWGQ